MKFKTVTNLIHKPENVLRGCGYFSIFDRKTQKGSFVRKLSGNRYPRFHLYLKETDNELIFDLHLDQSGTVYAGQKAHNADYDSSEVKQELVRIFQEVKKSIPIPEEEKPLCKTIIDETADQPNWLSKLFKKK
jgi:hypothetical protein